MVEYYAKCVSNVNYSDFATAARNANSFYKLFCKHETESENRDFRKVS